MIEDAVKATMELYKKLSEEINPDSNLFPILFSEACTTYRSFLIEKRRAEHNGHGEPLTDKQKEYIMNLVEKHNIDTMILTTFSRAKGKKGVAELSKSEASELIEYLKEVVQND